MTGMKVVLYPVSDLKHIEGFSAKRVEWLLSKIVQEKFWTKPLALDDKHGIVLDGQHRMEVAKKLNLKNVPVVHFRYSDVPIRSLRENHSFTWQDVVARALSGDIYPYKTVKHDFVEPLPRIAYDLNGLLS